jgi:hypothetical protein
MLALASCSSSSADSCAQYAAFVQTYNTRFAACTGIGGSQIPSSSCDESACTTSLGGYDCTDADRQLYQQATSCAQHALDAYDGGCSGPGLAVLQNQVFIECPSGDAGGGLSPACEAALQKNTAALCGDAG